MILQKEQRVCVPPVWYLLTVTEWSRLSDAERASGTGAAA